MHEGLAMAMAATLIQDHLRDGQAARARRTRKRDALANADVSIRLGRPDDSSSLERLGALDADRATAARLAALATEPWQRGVLVAELDGELVAAQPVAGGRSVADPFRPTAPIVQLLRVRAEQLRRSAPAGALRRVPRPSLHLRTHH